MGQYYKPIILTKDKKSIVGYWNGHKTMNGLKLTEHSYIGNHLCNCVENYLIKNGGGRVVWAGDYADEENGKKLNLYELAKKELKYDCESNTNARFLVNEDKKEYVDLWNVVSVDELTLHPLPLLTAEGNGKGGGDYYGIDNHYVGTWARDFIKLLLNSERGEIEGYKEIQPTFVTGYTLMEKLATIADLVGKSFTDSSYNYADDAYYIKSLKESVTKIRKAMPKKKKEEKKEEVKAAAGNGIPSDWKDL